MRRPIPRAVPCDGGSAIYTSSKGLNGRRNRPMDDGSKEQPQMAAGLDLGDDYSYLCLIDTEKSGEVMEEGRLRTTPEAFRRRFSSERSLHIEPSRRELTRLGLAGCSRSVAIGCWWPIPAR